MCVSMSVCIADLRDEIPNHTKLFGMMKKECWYYLYLLYNYIKKGPVNSSIGIEWNNIIVQLFHFDTGSSQSQIIIIKY